MKGVIWFKIKRGSRTTEIGFDYNEIVWNHLDAAGKNGLTVADIRRKTGISDQTIRNIIRRYLRLRRVRKYTTTRDNNIPLFYYVVINRWVNIL